MDYLNEIEEAKCSFNAEPKDLKTSIRNKYKRRLNWLADSLDNFICYSKLRLDKNKAGNIHNKDETLKLLKEAEKLRKKILVKSLIERIMDKNIDDNLDEMFGNN